MSNQSWNSKDYQTHAAFVPKLGKSLLDMLNALPQERILDLGCGDGVLTLDIMRTGAAVVGIDSDSEMVNAASAKGINAYLMSANDFHFEETFDAVFSNAVLHWVRPPEVVIRCIYDVLKKKGRFVAEFGGFGNVESARESLISEIVKRGYKRDDVDTWYFPTQKQYSDLLQQAGFEISDINLYSRPTPIGHDVKGWLNTFANNFLKILPLSERDSFIEDVAIKLRKKLPMSDGNYLMDYVRLRVLAYKS